MATYTLDNCDSTTGWATSDDGTLSLETTTKYEGTGSIKYIHGTGTSSLFRKVFSSAQDLTGAESFSYWIYIVDYTKVTGLRAYLATDGSNYYRYDYTVSSNGWNNITFAKGDMTTIGTPSWSNINRFYQRLAKVDTAPTVYVDYIQYQSGETSVEVIQVKTNISVASATPTITTTSTASISQVLTNISVASATPVITTIQNTSVIQVLTNISTSSIAPTIATQTNISISQVLTDVVVNSIIPIITTTSNIDIQQVLTDILITSISPVISSSSNISISQILTDILVDGLQPNIDTNSNVDITQISTNIDISSISPSVDTNSNISIEQVLTNIYIDTFNPSISFDTLIFIDLTNIIVNGGVHEIFGDCTIDIVLTNIDVLSLNPIIDNSSNINVNQELTNINIDCGINSISTVSNITIEQILNNVDILGYSPVISNNINVSIQQSNTNINVETGINLITTTTDIIINVVLTDINIECNSPIITTDFGTTIITALTNILCSVLTPIVRANSSLGGFKLSIYARLSTVCDRVFSERVEIDTTFPYVVYKISDSDALDSREDFMITVDIWDNNSDTTALETLTNSVADALNYYIYEDDYSFYHAYKQRQLEVPDPNPSIHRRQIIFVLKTYMK